MHIIACEVFRPELEFLLQSPQEDSALRPAVTYIKQGLHDTPDELRSTVQSMVRTLEEQGETTILMAYGFCGRGLAGVTGQSATLVVPRVHDCIPILLGSPQEKANETALGGSTYWLSAGWLQHSQLSFMGNRDKRYAEYLEQFGKDSADYLIEVEASWLQHYTNLCLIYWEGWTEEELAKLRNNAALLQKDKQLPLREVLGSPNFLQELLDGGGARCVRLAPGETLEIDGNGDIAVVQVQ